MRDSMKGNPEESLRQALAEFADDTGLGTASERVRQTLRREVRARARRRWTLIGLASAAALAAVLFGITLRSGSLTPQPPAQTNAHQGGGAIAVTEPAPESVAAVNPDQESKSGVRPATAKFRTGRSPGSLVKDASRGKARRKPDPAAEWRKGDVILSPWYFNTALPPAARSVLVRSEVDARTAMRFGVVSAGDTAPVEILFGEDGLPRAMRFVRHLPTQKN